MTNKLLPCPFCGGEARIETCNDNGAFRVSCYRIYECGATQYWYDFEAEAIAAWNRRAEPENEPLTLDELRQMDGEAVWLCDIKNPTFDGWHLVNVSRVDFFVMDKMGWKIPLTYLGSERFVYRYKPERSEG